MVKQLRIHYGDGFPTKVRKSLIPFIMSNLADAIVCFTKSMNENGFEIADNYAKVSTYVNLMGNVSFTSRTL